MALVLALSAVFGDGEKRTVGAAVITAPLVFCGWYALRWALGRVVPAAARRPLLIDDVVGVALLAAVGFYNSV